MRVHLIFKNALLISLLIFTEQTAPALGRAHLEAEHGVAAEELDERKEQGRQVWNLVAARHTYLPEAPIFEADCGA